MALQTANQFQLVPELASRFTSGVQGAQNIAGQFQVARQREQQIEQGARDLETGEELAASKRLVNSALTISALPDNQKLQALIKNRDSIAERGGNTADTDAGIALAQAGNFKELNEGLQGVISIGERRGFIKSLSSISGLTAEQREFAALSKQAGLSDKEITKAIKVKFGLEARAGESKDERIARDKKLAEDVAESQASIEGGKAGAKEKAKLKVQKELLPSIRGAIKQAEKEATVKGETFTALNRARAALPGLREVTEKLKVLADVATFTTGGKILNLLAKESGFGATKGATARTTMRAVVDNQVLPLLRDTFGAAFTKAEGDSLRNTLLDPDTAPDQMKATLDAFIEQKTRNIETSERELGIALPEGVTEDDIETTMQANNMTREQVLERLGSQ